jgi:acyl-CoA thioesterase-2
VSLEIDLNKPVEMMLKVLRLEDTGARTSEDIFVGGSHPIPTGRVYGGQVVSQCVVAAAATVSDEQHPHSMHGYFLRPGDLDLPITFAVDRIHDGRSFSRRRVQAYQAGTPIFSGIISFQTDDTGLDHQTPMPRVPGPEEIDPSDDMAGSFFLLRSNPIEARRVPLAPDGSGTQATWMRVREPLPDDAGLHRAVLSYMSDFSIQEPSLRANGVTWQVPGIKSASLDHAIWWHRFARVDEWLLYVNESASTQGGRGMNTGRFYTQDGSLVASTAQEIMLRVPGV